MINKQFTLACNLISYYKLGMNLLSTQQAAEILGIESSGVRKLILRGRLPATKVGRDHVIQESDLALVAVRKRGRPFKPNDPAPARIKKAAKSSKPRKKKAS